MRLFEFDSVINDYNRNRKILMTFFESFLLHTLTYVYFMGI